MAAHQHRRHAAPARTADIRRLQPVVRSHQAHHPAMLAVAAQRADDGPGLDPHFSSLRAQLVGRWRGEAVTEGAPPPSTLPYRAPPPCLSTTERADPLVGIV